MVSQGSVYNVSETSVFSSVKLQMSNDENKHGKMESSWHCKPASKFTLCGDIGYRYHILQPRLRDRIYDEVNHWKSKEVYFKALLQCLTTVKIFGFGERFHTKDVFILVVEFLLKNAKVLEKMVITEPWVMQNGMHNMQLKFLQVSQKLFSFPRSSPHAVVMFPF